MKRCRGRCRVSFVLSAHSPARLRTDKQLSRGSSRADGEDPGCCRSLRWRIMVPQRLRDVDSRPVSDVGGGGGGVKLCCSTSLEKIAVFMAYEPLFPPPLHSTDCDYCLQRWPYYNELESDLLLGDV
ncbi:unnamed protein product [Pleuronectes platessa]|uniref:Uncharacterized protein n=1 Tax=Pleuronectes platessa TaxID=8262 RepID=A0A9N7YE50_PLEPL|nr:unnamed protein product [Pleuronectes platessa]